MLLKQTSQSSADAETVAQITHNLHASSLQVSQVSNTSIRHKLWGANEANTSSAMWAAAHRPVWSRESPTHPRAAQTFPRRRRGNVCAVTPSAWFQMKPCGRAALCS